MLEEKNNSLYLEFGESSVKLPPEKANNPILKDYIGKEVIMGIRPECIHDEDNYLNAMPESVIETDVEVTELMGAEIYLYLACGEQKMTARVSSRSTARAGDVIKVALDTSRIHLFDKDTERFIIH